MNLFKNVSPPMSLLDFLFFPYSFKKVMLCYLLKSQNSSSHQLNSKNNGPDYSQALKLFFVFCCNRWEGWTWLAQLFQVFMRYTYRQKKIIMISDPWPKLVDIFFISLTEHFVLRKSHWVLTSAQNWPKTTISLWHSPVKA